MAVREFDLGDDMWVMILPVAELREQTVNAQVMQPRHMERLTENIKLRGQLEQLPYCYWPNRQGAVEIISGHHRARAARGAGKTDIPCLVDTRPMTESAKRAKQVAHNEIHGSPDEAILQSIIAGIDNVDDLLATGLPEDWLPGVGRDDTTLGLPHADFEWHTVTLAFLSSQLDDLQGLLDAVDARTQLIGLAERVQFEEFAKRVIDFGRSRNIRSVAAAIAVLSAVAREQVEQELTRRREEKSE